MSIKCSREMMMSQLGMGQISHGKERTVNLSKNCLAFTQGHIPCHWTNGSARRIKHELLIDQVILGIWRWDYLVRTPSTRFEPVVQEFRHEK